MDKAHFPNPFLGAPQYSLPVNNAAWGSQPPAGTPTAILVSDLSELLEPMFGELQAHTDALKGLVKGCSPRMFGCDVEHMKELWPGLNKEELKKQAVEDPPRPWRPKFLKSMNDPSNEFWVKKILDAALKDKKIQEMVDAGTIPREFWTYDCLKDNVLKQMWSNAAKEVKKRVNPLAQARGEANAKRGKKKPRQTCLLATHMQLALGTNGQTQFKYKIRCKMKTIPAKLMVQEVTSDVVDNKCDSDTVPKGIEIEDYRAGCWLFKFEGTPPFYCRRMWNKAFQEMDEQILKKDSSQHVQRLKRGKVSDRPLRTGLKIYLFQHWTRRRQPSPEGWQVDEEQDQGKQAMNKV
ncbi:hypothetical protein BDV93DRAFT_508745 [Ceratobasidium sp. AG-I]|nr:hypothetical protein BDV93DRAFT_508745 [Ceratobasidium sp. AG-I]